ncbi:MAG: DUF5331 domain-containing protein [Trichodesmium sp. St16_bin4-tuft]|nr:DUF5331 domain-containing protein [Trichodesmium sp. St4_bin8_1]MDE5072973.1 DUF5331 domain-containing protein [Trichodesmium sp. St5_bin8]MDE5077043.1 DUF5331 domain-containing protein [Trichodesmium sp. St2_bin6]MDE5091289.1 DUF5331 domain-containing protein [Trichodesmium sp. St18_bin3_1_1]MDE5099649.1 DUF5331 domain-containing protein [Trichodesmium sp. St16_bin4-tuft]
MVFFKELSTSLKQKWLEYYKKNRPWLILHMTEQNTVQTPDGGRRPVSYLILGILNALEPELEALMFPFSKLKADADSLVEVLGLNFDPDIAIGEKPGSSLDKSTPMNMNQIGEDAQEPPGGNSPLMPDTIEDSNDLGTAAAAAITGAAAVAGGVALAAGLNQDFDDLADNDQGDSDFELENDNSSFIELDSDSEADNSLDIEMELPTDKLDTGLDPDSETDDDFDLELDSDSDADDDFDLELDSDSETDDDFALELDSDSETDDDFALELDSDSEADDDLTGIDLEDLDENSSNDLTQGKDSSNFLVEDIPESLDESGLDELDSDDLDLFGKNSSDEIADIDLSELGNDNEFDDFSSNDLTDLDLDFELDGEESSLDEVALDSLVGDKKSSNDDDLEGLLG